MPGPKTHNKLLNSLSQLTSPPPFISHNFQNLPTRSHSEFLQLSAKQQVQNLHYIATNNEVQQVVDKFQVHHPSDSIFLHRSLLQIGDLLHCCEKALSSCKTLQYALLVYSSYIGYTPSNELSPEICINLDIFYRSMRTALNTRSDGFTNSIADVVQGSAMILIYALSSGRPVNEVITHIEGLHTGFMWLKGDPAAIEETDIMLVRQLCLIVFQGMNECLFQIDKFEERYNMNRVFILVDSGLCRLFEVLEGCLVFEDLKSQCLGEFSAALVRQEILTTLGTMLNTLLAHYFRGQFNRCHPRRDEQHISMIQKTINLVSRMLPHFPAALHLYEKILPSLRKLDRTQPGQQMDATGKLESCRIHDRDITTYITFGFAKLVSSFPSHPLAMITNQASMSAAISLCRIFSLMSVRSHNNQTLCALLLTGMVIKSSQNRDGRYLSVHICWSPVHQWLRDTVCRLRDEYEGNDIGCLFDSVIEAYDVADSISSLSDLWTPKASCGSVAKLFSTIHFMRSFRGLY